MRAPAGKGSMNYGRYQILKEIGKGSMGVVYEAHDPNLDLSVALKVLRQDRVESESFVRRFIAEARVLGRLDHTNIVRVYNVDEDHGTAYIAMEFIEGESLGDIAQKKRCTMEEIIQLGITISNALGYAHQKKIVHRDVKPGNILIKTDGVLKITDFGIAHIQDESAAEKTQAGEILGTPAYMSPEQVKGQQIDGRSDIFSLGIILYELCTGTRPFKGENVAAIFHAVAQEEPVEITKLNPAVPKKLSHIIMKCLSKNREKRFETAEDLAGALSSCIAEIKPKKTASPAADKKRSFIMRYALYAGWAALLVSLIAGGAWYVRSWTKKEPVEMKQAVLSSSINIESKPSGADVFVDNSALGKTPLKLELPEGKHEVRLTMPNFNDWKAPVQVVGGVATPLVVQLTPVDAK
jgi:serine/threonine protein kinase